MKHNYSFKVKGELDPKDTAEHINKIFPGFFGQAKLFFNSTEGMAEFVEWLQSLPEGSEYKAELPMWEARLKAMEVA